MEAWRKRKNTRKTDEGFSLVEVLVCIALVALVCVPLFSGLRVSATLNNRAHHTQKVTAYAQEELEIIKSISVENYIKEFQAGSVIDGVSYAYITSGSEWDEMNTAAAEIKNKFTNMPVGVSPEEQEAIDAMFTPFICEKKDIKIGGKNYTLKAKFMPAEYSQYDKNSAANVNVAGFYDVAQADAVRFPVISDEVNLYDDICVKELQSKIADPAEQKTEADIMANMKKTVLVTIQSPVSGDGATAEMSARCDVTYVYPKSGTPKAEVSYCVYNSTYELYPASGADKGDESGGNVFIMARAFRGTDNECVNELVVKSTGDTNVYFVLGRKNESDTFYNFNNIFVNDEKYSENYNIASSLVPGEKPIAGTNGKFFCNIKENAAILDDSASGKYDSIGREKYKAVGYAVEIDMIDQADAGELAAHLEATKIDR